MADNPKPLPGTRHIMEWDDYDAACDVLDRAQAKHRAERKSLSERNRRDVG